MTKLIMPKAPSDEDSVKLFLGQNWPRPGDANWLVEHLQKTESLREVETDEFDAETKGLREARRLTNALKYSSLHRLPPEQQAAGAFAKFFVEALTFKYEEDFQELKGGLRIPNRTGRLELVLDDAPLKEELGRLAARARAEGISFRGVFPKLSHEERLALAYFHAVRFEDCVNWDLLEEFADSAGVLPKQMSSSQRNEIEGDPSRLVFWLSFDAVGTLAHVKNHLKEVVDDSAFLRKMKGALFQVGIWGMQHAAHVTNYAEIGMPFQEAANSMLALALEHEGHPPSIERHPLWKELVLRWWMIAFHRREAETDSEVQESVNVVAGRVLGELRKRLAEANADDTVDLLNVERDNIEAATHFLFTRNGLWAGLKPLLLLLRASKTPLFASDLSWWDQSRAPRREPGPSAVAQRMMYGFHAFASAEEAEDNALQGLRSDLADYCLQRLKTNKVGDLVEPSPMWRQAYAMATTELGINPKGKGHQILHQAKNDPDNDVQAAAEAAYPILRSNRGLAKDQSPRRAITHALWWLRQAHLFELGVDVDAGGASITRVEEVRFTTAPTRKQDEQPPKPL